MYSLHLTLLFIAQIYCEWVEISQQHYNYKTPLRQTHKHPLLASTPPKRIDLERTTNRNRIYINHSVPDYNWNTESNQLFKGDVLQKGAVNFKNGDDFANKRPPNDKNKDVLVVRIRKPENTRNKEKKEIAKDVLNPDSDSGVRKTTPGNELDQRKPLGHYKGPIEVLNISELEYTTADTISNSELNDEFGKNNLKRKDNIITTNTGITTPTDKKRQPESRRKTTNRVEINTPRPEREYKTKPPLLKTTNMRRVNIVRSTSTYRTPTQQFNEEEYKSNTPAIPSKSTEIIDVKPNGRPPTTPYRFPHIGHVKRVNITNTLRTTSKPRDETNKPTKDLEDKEDTLTENSTVNGNSNAIHRMNKPIPERIKTTPTVIKAHKTRYDNKNIHKIITPEEKMVEEILKEDEGKEDFTVHKVASLGNIEKVHNPSDSEIGKRRDEVKNVSTVASNLKLETDIDGIVENDESDDQFNTVYRVSHSPGSTETAPTLTTVEYKTKNIVTERPEEVAQIERYLPNPYKPIRPSQQPIPEFVTKDENFVNGDPQDNLEISTKYVVNLKPTEPSYEETARPGNRLEGTHKSQGPTKENKEQKKEDQISDKTKPSAIEKLIKFLKTVTEIISRNSCRGVQGKMRYLEDLRDTILANIEERLEAAFPDDTSAASGRTGRGLRGRQGRSANAARGHVEFPSSESALMTISFLTFAVFLIKLILQVIQVYKNKTMMVMPTVISAAVGRALAKHRAAAAVTAAGN